MFRTRVFALATLSFLSLALASAEAGVFVGVGIPGPCFRPYRHCYGPRVFVGVAPVVVGAPVYVAPAPAPVIIQQAPPVIQVPATSAYPAPAAQPGLPPAPVPVGN